VDWGSRLASAMRASGCVTCCSGCGGDGTQHPSYTSRCKHRVQSLKSRRNNISVCICTYKRPQLLRWALEKLGNQETDNLFTYSIVVVDNDQMESAKGVVDTFASSSVVPITYCVEVEQNIALARNRAFSLASGGYIAFLDEDEFPVQGWLLALYSACGAGVDGVLGPVVPHYENSPPSWVIKGKFFDRPRHQTGFKIDWTEGRTGNLLLKREILKRIEGPFRAEYGSGGEDRDLFARLILAGHSFIWCDEAVVYETVPPARWKRSFMLRRALLRGKVDLVDPAERMPNLARSTIAIPLYAVLLPFLFLTGHHRFMRFLVKLFDHLGRILTFLRVDPVKEKYVTE